MGLQPPLKWAGGKRWLVPILRPVWKQYKDYRLVEPFCGGLSIALGLLPDKALLNDINPHLINFYEWVKKGMEIDLEMINDPITYYKYRSEFNNLILYGNPHSKRAAELFYYLNRTGFNGLCRFNRQGMFNVPFGRHKRINYQINLLSYRDIFRNWTFSTSSYLSICLNKNDFIFADPPYDVEFRNYSKDGFDWQEQINLANWLCAHDGPVILCNQATDRIINLYQECGYILYYLQVKILIAANGNRSPTKIVIATRNLDSLF